ncbi:MAG: hypothetical protein NC185_08835, partial [Ruminococcus sp.]|nr:hypothetical protein [Ruminococcus sp.]
MPSDHRDKINVLNCATRLIYHKTCQIASIINQQFRLMYKRTFNIKWKKHIFSGLFTRFSHIFSKIIAKNSAETCSAELNLHFIT